VEVQPENAVWWTQLAYAVRRSETIEKAEAILLEAREIHPRNVVILVNLASYASLTGRTEEAKARLRHAIDLDKDARRMALDVEDLKPLWDWIGSLE
jgi:Flp pilus assembly protein TadD